MSRAEAKVDGWEGETKTNILLEGGKKERDNWVSAWVMECKGDVYMCLGECEHRGEIYRMKHEGFCITAGVTARGKSITETEGK